MGAAMKLWLTNSSQGKQGKFLLLAYFTTAFTSGETDLYLCQLNSSKGADAPGALTDLHYRGHRFLFTSASENMLLSHVAIFAWRKLWETPSQASRTYCVHKDRYRSHGGPVSTRLCRNVNVKNTWKTPMAVSLLHMKGGVDNQHFWKSVIFSLIPSHPSLAVGGCALRGVQLNKWFLPRDRNIAREGRVILLSCFCVVILRGLIN